MLCKFAAVNPVMTLTSQWQQKVCSWGQILKRASAQIAIIQWQCSHYRWQCAKASNNLAIILIWLQPKFAVNLAKSNISTPIYFQRERREDMCWTRFILATWMWPILSDLDFQLEQSENENPALLSCMVLFRMLLQTYGLESALDEFDYHRLRHKVVKLSAAPSTLYCCTLYNLCLSRSQPP